MKQRVELIRQNTTSFLFLSVNPRCVIAVWCFSSIVKRVSLKKQPKHTNEWAIVGSQKKTHKTKQIKNKSLVELLCCCHTITIL